MKNLLSKAVPVCMEFFLLATFVGGVTAVDSHYLRYSGYNITCNLSEPAPQYIDTLLSGSNSVGILALGQYNNTTNDFDTVITLVFNAHGNFNFPGAKQRIILSAKTAYNVTPENVSAFDTTIDNHTGAYAIIYGNVTTYVAVYALSDQEMVVVHGFKPRMFFDVLKSLHLRKLAAAPKQAVS